MLGLLALCSASFAIDRGAMLDEANLLVLPRERQLPTVELVDEQGLSFTSDALRERWFLLFFGFTACPDICPTTLSDMRRLLNQLPPTVRDQLQVILVSADPARDTPEALRTYLSYYRADFKGLTGEMPELQKLSKGLGLPFVSATDTTVSDYNVSHSSNLAIVGPNGTLRGHIRAPLKLEGLSRALQQLIDAK
ncbi:MULTISPECIES: SCO family protein [Stutzerimonas]|uniref:SCO family protein n=1 Tax=Stutzerimonas chloritidismutans TaxID=203192 RepID=A0ABU9M9Z5_STUCH|nr:SCO family protein [Stutzerimonas xanthomarina]MBU0812659.1 SCO family protein [Gammaproteobacteria bacterium]HAQ88939.1 cytochrome c oxidase assembly protein [Pseudomonas sp.]MBK3845632.1 SCO family protein [Stutzerimonas xanthomarina]MBK3845931.1 SCO family protein [Stutzerimonas xanthomarina]MBK3846540.1 SCO family protein [Stutzerimonas xanthomarina]|tara:strand:+ start:87 stop:668 length:582 start_codon:yes stop_codon:yes gene_type:complete